MYAYNDFSKRRPSGWSERRRRFERLIAHARNKLTAAEKTETRPTDAPKHPKR